MQHPEAFGRIFLCERYRLTHLWLTRMMRTQLWWLYAQRPSLFLKRIKLWMVMLLYVIGRSSFLCVASPFLCDSVLVLLCVSVCLFHSFGENVFVCVWEKKDTHKQKSSKWMYYLFNLSLFVCTFIEIYCYLGIKEKLDCKLY